MKELLIYGVGEFANIAHEYFTYDSEYSVSGFIVDEEYYSAETYKNLPVMKYSEVESQLDSIYIFVAISASKINTLRERIFKKLDARGANFASYVSSKAFIWHDVRIGRNVFIFENNVLQTGVKIDDNCVLWSGNHIGHQTEIQKNCFISSHVVVSGYCTIGSNSYIGVNATIIDHIEIAEKTVVGAGTLIIRDTDENCIYVGSPGKKIPEKNSQDVKFN